MKKILAIDIGSTSTKWGFHNGNEWILTGLLKGSECLPAFFTDNIPDWVTISNVNTPDKSKIFKTLAEKLGIPCTVVISQKNKYGITNNYSMPHSLGSDRWAAMIGAKSKHSGALLVVDAGTAITIDCIDNDGIFKGGTIAPGYYLMKESLAQKTANLKLLDGQFSPYPTATADAIATGCINAITGSIESAYQRFNAENLHTACIMTGGDAEWLIPYLQIPVIHHKHLVLDGLRYIGECEASN